MSSFFIDQDLIIPSMEGYSLSQVFRGLICFTNGPSAKIYNTTTRQLVVLPDIEGSNIIAEDRNKDFMYHMGHDHIHDQYKVICIVSAAIEICGRYMSEHWVLLLGGGDGSSRWRKISNPFRPHLPLIKRVTIKGSVYYLAWVCLFFPVLFSFDYRSEEISMFQEPEDNAFWYWPRLIGLIEYGGRVAVLHHAHDVMELWVMDDVEKNMWSRETFLLDPSHMHLLNGIRLRVQGTTRNGEVIFVPQNTSSTGMMIVQPQSDALYHFFLYNLENNHLRKVEIKDTSNRYLTNIWDVIIRLDDVENLLFL
ncbi:hypothetical protein N665_0104s0308 [Sinapis alba]|nr:hypothetical protein N665_0104s0308 [Sinapis alba]